PLRSLGRGARTHATIRPSSKGISMAETLTTPNTVLGAVLPAARGTRLATQIGAVILGTVALTVAAKIQVPVWPVHITLQSMVVAILAGALGWRLGVATVALYI